MFTLDVGFVSALCVLSIHRYYSVTKNFIDILLSPPDSDIRLQPRFQLQQQDHYPIFLCRWLTASTDLRRALDDCGCLKLAQTLVVVSAECERVTED